jgi:hypothetical protein
MKPESDVIDRRVLTGTEHHSFSRSLATARANGLALAWWAGSEAVDLDAAGDVDDAGLIFFAGGEVAGLLGGSGAGPVGPVADEEVRVEDLE